MPRAAVLSACLSLVIAGLTGAPAAADFSSCLDGLKAAAIESGIRRATVSHALDAVSFDQKVMDISQIQPEFKTPIWDYLAFLVDEQRVADGRAMIRAHDAVLRAAEKRFGVDRYVIAAVWGVETDFGRETGSFYLPQALATLACAHARAKFFRGELMAALELVDRGDLALKDLYGSWAGAFGQTQFIPTTYRRLAVDFDGDGRRDLVASVADALGSTANYLKRAGWRSGIGWGFEVRLPAGYRGVFGRKAKAALSTWAKRGIRRVDGSPPSGNVQAGLLVPAGTGGPAFLVTGNFDAIYSYNAAESYALAISHLADRMRGQGGFAVAWPTADPGLSRAERLAVQKLLIGRGHDIGEADGKIGARTREAIKAEQRRLGMEPDGRAGRKLYRALNGS